MIEARMRIGAFKMVPGRARIAQNASSPSRYVSKPSVFHPAFLALGTYFKVRKQSALRGQGSYLMVTQAQISNQAVVLENVLPELLDTGFVLEVVIPLEQPSVQLHHLSQGQMLGRRFVQPTNCLDQLKETSKPVNDSQ